MEGRVRRAPVTRCATACGRVATTAMVAAGVRHAANSLFVSDCLTTKGQAPDDDLRMIEDLGFEIVRREAC